MYVMLPLTKGNLANKDRIVWQKRGTTVVDYSWFLFPYYSNAIAGESALDRLACALGGKTMLPHILQNVPQLLSNGRF